MIPCIHVLLQPFFKLNYRGTIGSRYTFIRISGELAVNVFIIMGVGMKDGL